jgi:glutathione synthase/RimK-type ligase-like ATP-grasp enzyme
MFQTNLKLQAILNNQNLKKEINRIMKRVGILTGREVTFPESIIKSINERGNGEVVAEMVTVGGIRLDEPKKYDVVIDRISHEVPYYRATLKRMALEGTYVINNPFWWSADDKFFNFSLAAKIGVAIPKTVLLPQQDYIEDITSESLRNLEFPLDWEGIVNYVGFPAFLKPFDGGGWKNVSKIHSLEELWYVYNQTGKLCMTLQEGIEFDQFVRCYCVGQEKVLIMPYDPTKPYLSGMQYVNVTDYLSPELHARVERDVVTLCKALGYDLNTVEFAIKDGIPYAIDFMNPAPDAELASVGEFNHNWIVNAMTEFIFKKLETGFETPEYRWTSMLNPSQKQQQAETVIPAKSAVAAKPKAAAKPAKKTAADKNPKAKNAGASE